MEKYILEISEKRKLFEETLQLTKTIYEKDATGGYLHIVLEDGNLKNKHIIWCIDNIIVSDDSLKDVYLKCALNMLKMTSTQRKKLYNTI
jgi:hypothetical protein